MSKLAHSNQETMDELDRRRAIENGDGDLIPAQTGKHTPGPWHMDGDGFDSVAAQDCGTDGYEIFTKDAAGDVDLPICTICDVCDDDESQANARLIAAATKLLEAAKQAADLLQELKDGGAENPELEGLLSAINEAEGR